MIIDYVRGFPQNICICATITNTCTAESSETVTKQKYRREKSLGE